MTRKQRRLTIIGGSLAVLAVAAALVLNAMRDSIVFFSTPAMVAEKHIQAGKRFRLGGLVQPGSLVLALGLTLIQSTLPVLGARWRDPTLMNVARSTALAQLLFVAFSFAALVTLHVTSDFSVVNVFENSHSLKPLIYKVTGVWGNHEGSMLLWVLIQALFGGLVAAFGNNLPLSLRAHVLAVQAWIASAFYLFILITS